MITDVRASKMFLLLHQGESVAGVARRLRMSQRTVRKYRDADQLPSQMHRPQRTYRTRQDPLADYWNEIEAFLEKDSRLKPYAILDWLKQKYNTAEGTPRVSDTIRRTLERRIHQWKLKHGAEQEVKFPQTHHAGDVIAFDFVVMNSLKVTVRGKRFDHTLFHSVFTYSNWEYVHLCFSESFEALSAGLQDTLHHAGGAPRRVRSDSLSAAVNNLSSDKEFAVRYRDLLDYYGVQGHRINARKPHENGDVESSHGHFKDALDQALRLRGSRDFSCVEEYMLFVRQLTDRRNAPRQQRFREEVTELSPLPPQRLSTFTVLPVTVKSDSVIRVKRNAYSVNSKYIGLQLEIRIYQDHLELWYQNECVERMPRQFGYGKEAIDFRHVIDSLVRKPGAFANYKYVNHMFPTTRFRMAYDQLLKNTTESSAAKQYLRLLHAAKHEGLDLVDDALRWFLTSGKAIAADEILAVIAAKQQVPAPTDVAVEAPDLSVFDSLLHHKEVYDEHESWLADTNTADEQVDPGLDVYDRHIQAAGATEGTAASHVSRESSLDGRPGSSRELVSHPVPCGPGREGVPGQDAESHCSPDAKCASAGRQDVGQLRLDSSASACHPAIRDASPRGLLESPGQRADLRETGFGKNDAPLGFGRSVGQAGPIRVLLDVSDVGPGAAARQTGLAIRASHQEAPHVPGVDHRRSGLCTTEPRGNGSLVHTALRTVRTRQCPDQLEPALFQMGADLQGPHDHRCCDRSTDPSLSDHRTQHPQLSARGGQEEAAPTSCFFYFQGSGDGLTGAVFQRSF